MPAKPRGNPNKLQPIRDKQKASELGKIGGKASGRVRRRNRAMREVALAILNGSLSDQDKRLLKEAGGTLKEISDNSKKSLAFWRCLQKATLSGSTSDIAKLLEIAGEYTPSQEITPLPTERPVIQVVAPPGTKVAKNAKSKKN